MLAISANSRIFFFQSPIDMRKGVEALSSIVENCFAGELLSGASGQFHENLLIK